MEIKLPRDRTTTFHFRSLHSALHALAAIRIPQAPLALRQHIHRLIARGVKPVAGNNPIFHDGERRVPPLLEPSTFDVGGPTGLVEELHAGNLGEAGDLVGEVAAEELDPGGGDGVAAERVSHGGEFGDAGGAGGGGEVAAALEEASEGGGGGGCAGGGFVEVGFGGLLEEVGEEGGEGLGVEAGGI